MTATPGVTASSAVLHGRQVGYRDLGAGTPPFVLVHGIGSTGQAWEPVANDLAARGHRVISVDLPGHGLSSKERGDYSLGALASVLRDLLDRLEIDRCVLVGHSLGGGIALQFAYQYPERLTAMGLISSGGLGVETSRVLKWTAMPGSGIVMATAFNNTTLSAAEALSRRWQRWRTPPGAISESTLARLREIADPEHRAAFLATLRAVVDASGQRVSAVERLPILDRTPTLIVWGAKDHILPAEHGSRAHDLLPHSRLVVFEDAGHEPHVDDPDRTADLLAELAAAAPPSAPR